MDSVFVFLQQHPFVQEYLSHRITRVGFVVPVSFSSMQVSPVGTKPHFSITRPEAGLSK